MSRLKYFFQAILLSIKIKSPISFVVLFFGFGAAFLPMYISLTLKEFSNGVNELFYHSDMRNSVILSFFTLSFLYIIQSLYTHVQRYYKNEDAMRIKQYLETEILILLSSVPYKYIENYNNFIDKVEFVKTYSGEKAAGNISLLSGWIIGVISFVSLAIILIPISPWIFILIIITCIPATILSYLQKDELYHVNSKLMKEGRLTIHYADVCRKKSAIKDIRFFGLYSYLKEKKQCLSKIHIAKKMKLAKKHFIYNGTADLLRNGVYVGVVIVTAIRIYEEPALGIGTFMLAIAASGQLQNVTTSLITDILSIFSDIKYIEDFFVLLATERDDKKKKRSAPYKNVDIEFNNVCFSYPGSDIKAANELNVKIKQGEKVAIVGANGSGKSTFVNLLCGLYAPEKGSVKINGVNIFDHLDDVRRSISTIFQNICKYHDTLRNNITISDLSRSAVDDEIITLTKLTGANEVIQSAKNELDETIGIFSNMDNNLSGGQWQKIAITRALYRKDARVLILDEPTSSLDPIAEANIYRSFSMLTGDKTTILVSHRLGITSVVDRILVFDKGSIIEDGKHADLMKKNGVYSKMYKAQARWYAQSDSIFN